MPRNSSLSEKNVFKKFQNELFLPKVQDSLISSKKINTYLNSGIIVCVDHYSYTAKTRAVYGEDNPSFQTATALIM